MDRRLYVPYWKIVTPEREILITCAKGGFRVLIEDAAMFRSAGVPCDVARVVTR